MKNPIEVFNVAPSGFTPQVEISAIYVEVKGEILFLKRSIDKPEGNRWGVPAGKIEANEHPETAASRELYEETGIACQSSYQLESVGLLYMRKPGFDYIYHLFVLKLPEKPAITLSSEHTDILWSTPSGASALDLMLGAWDALDYYRLQRKRKPMKGSLNAYLILEQGGHVLLGRRKNTGFYDGFYCFVSGRVEDDESASLSIAREAYEEANVAIHPQNLKLVHMMHRYENWINLDLFFHCSTWDGPIINKELDRCDDLRFFPISALPENTIGFVKEALLAVTLGSIYSEAGWSVISR